MPSPPRTDAHASPSGVFKTNTLHTLEGEHGAPQVQGFHRMMPHTWIRVAGCGLLVLILFIAHHIYSKRQASMSKMAQAREQQSTLQSAVPKRSFNLVQPLLVTPPSSEVPVISAPNKSFPVSLPFPPLPLPILETTPRGWMRYPNEPKPSSALDKSSSALMVNHSSNQAGVATHASDHFTAHPLAKLPIAQALEAVQGTQNLQAHRAIQAGETPHLGSLLESTQTATQHARSLGNRNFIVPKGTFIQCVLQTKVDTSIPGMTRCTVSHNVYSDNGKVVLIERGSTISGEYQAGLHQGQKRVFVLWNRLKTPNGMVIDLDSPATDPLGAAGLPGRINRHFWERFGSAIAMSLIEDAGKVAVQVAAPKKQNITAVHFGDTAQLGQEMATETLKHMMHIPPTLYKNHGDRVGVYLARDLHFSEVYDVFEQ